jgi:predicted nucleotidyltransferase component of viral defense system
VIRKQDILERARSWGLRPDIVEKDYVLGWLLAAVARNAELRAHWVFKGGTCLKKCYFETYRFSEDLDFSLRPAASYTPEALLGLLRTIAQEAHELSGIEFPVADVKLVERRNKQGQTTYQGKVPYRGPLEAPHLANILFDLTQHELLVDEGDERAVFHPYPDDLPDDLTVVTYSLEELFAEKTRALFERTRPRDLYDVIQVVENHADNIDFELAREFFQRKCSHKEISAPSAKNLMDLVLGADELKADWAGMLAHQLQALPPIDPILGRLGAVLGWLDAPVALAQQPVGSAARPPSSAPQPKALGNPAHWTIVAPPSVTFWGSAPIEQIRFAGANRLMIAFTYHGKGRVAEPYSLRRAAAGHLTLFAWVRGDPNIKQFRIDEIRDLSVTRETFVPQYEIELTGSMIPSARAGTRTRRTRLPRFTSGRTYVFRCPFCDREFKHERNNAALRPHQTPDGSTCVGRRGYLKSIE